MNCEICKNKVAETFLKKLVGTYVKDKKGKMHIICFDCQNKFQTKQAAMEKMGL